MSGSGKFEGKKDLSWTVLGKNFCHDNKTAK